LSDINDARIRRLIQECLALNRTVSGWNRHRCLALHVKFDA